MRTFVLERDEDETGVSGTGTVAEGVLFDDGSAAMHWIVGEYRSSVFWPAPDAEQAIDSIHGHNGRTRVVFS